MTSLHPEGHVRKLTSVISHRIRKTLKILQILTPKDTEPEGKFTGYSDPALGLICFFPSAWPDSGGHFFPTHVPSGRVPPARAAPPPAPLPAAPLPPAPLPLPLTCYHLLRVVGFHVAVILSCPLRVPLAFRPFGVIRVSIVFQNDDLERAGEGSGGVSTPRRPRCRNGYESSLTASRGPPVLERSLGLTLPSTLPGDRLLICLGGITDWQRFATLLPIPQHCPAVRSGCGGPCGRTGGGRGGHCRAERSQRSSPFPGRLIFLRPAWWATRTQVGPSPCDTGRPLAL